MSGDLEDKDLRLQQAKKLVEYLERGEENQANNLLTQLTQFQQTEIFQDLGKLTREIHESLSNFQVDARLSELAAQEIPDATARLNYVIELTHNAAHTTLGAAEDAIPVCDELIENAGQLHQRWQNFVSRELSVEDFRQLTKDIDQYLGTVTSGVGRVKDDLQDVMIAQDYQDITGQAIRRVITLVQDIEESLVGFMKVSAEHQASEGGKQVDPIAPSGPHIPGIEEAGEALTSQDEVDDLLSSLGF